MLPASERWRSLMTDKMLAYIGWQEGEEWVLPIHGETRGKAKSNFMRFAPVDTSDLDFRLVRVKRLPAMDDKPFTPENLNAADWHYVDEDGEPLSNANFVNDCRCAVCRPSLEPWQKQVVEIIEDLKGKKIIQRPR